MRINLLLGRIISIMICLVFLMNLTVFAASTGGGSEKYASVLRVLGIVDNEEDTDRYLTRAELAMFSARIQNISNNNLIDYGFSNFKDISFDNPYFSYINFAVGQGFMEGIGTGEFAPYEAVTAAQAKKVIICVLGYKVPAEAQGGFPSGYEMLANQLRISGNENGNEKMTLNGFYAMIFKALDVQLMTLEGFRGTSFEYRSDKNRTLLGAYFGLEKITGIVTATEITYLSAEQRLQAGHIMIGETVYKTEEQDVKGLLGLEVIAFADADEDYKSVKIILADERRNSFLLINAEDIESTSSGTLAYWESERIKNVSIYPKLCVIYNDFAVPDFDHTLFDITQGEIVLIDNNGDGEYDVAKISEYYNIIVGGVEALNREIYDAYDESLELILPQDTRKYSIINTEGENLKFSDIQRLDVLSVFKSKDGDRILIIINQNSMFCTLEEKYGEEIKVEGVWFKKGDRFDEASVKAGDTGVLRFDAFQKAVSFEQKGSASGILFGFLFDAIREEGLNGKVLFKIFTASAKMEVFYQAEKVEVDKVLYKTSEKLFNALLKDEQGKVKKDVIRYRVNGNNEIDFLDTPITTAQEEGHNTLNHTFPMTGNQTFRKASMTFGGKMSINTSTIVFEVPYDITDDEKYYYTKANNSFGEGDYPVEGYNLDKESGYADVVLFWFKADGLGISSTQSVMLVDSIKKVLNEEGQEVMRLEGHLNKNRTELDVEDNSLIADIGAGDIIRFRKDHDGNVIILEQLYRYATDTIFDKSVSSSYYASFRMQTGYVYSNEKTLIRLSQEMPLSKNVQMDQLNNFLISSSGIYVIDRSANTPGFEHGSSNDITAYNNVGTNCSRVLIFSHSGEAKIVVVFKN